MEEPQSLLMLNPRSPSQFSLLNESTLAKVFGHLDLYDLLQVGEIDVNYQRIIGENIISNGILDISAVSQHYSTRHVFKMFGEFATDLRVKETDIQWKDDRYTYIEEIFRLINKRCTIGRLKSIAIALDRPKEDGKLVSHLVHSIPHVFNEIETLSIDMRMNSGKSGKQPKLVAQNFDGLLEILLSNCPKLHTLKLLGQHENWNFLMQPQILTLQSLSFENCAMYYSKWVEFIGIGARPLKCLEITLLMFMNHRSNPNEFLHGVIGTFPNLEKFTLDKANFMYCNRDWGLLQNLRALKELRITCSYDNDKLIQTLAQMNTVEMLSAMFLSSVNVNDIKSLTNLRSIEIMYPYHEFIPLCSEILQLPHIHELALTNQYDSIEKEIISKIVELASVQLRTLKISPKTKCTSGLYSSLVKIRQVKLRNAPPLHLHARFDRLKRYRPAVIIAYKIN